MDPFGPKHQRGGPRPNGGRRPLPADVRRRHRRTVSLTEREYKLVCFLATKKQVTVQDAIYLLLKASMPILDRAEAASEAAARAAYEATHVQVNATV